jgi:putative chitinase
MPIAQTVGFDAVNQQDDVLLVQALLNLNLGKLPGISFLSEDGSFGPSTRSAIQEFQQTVVTPGSASGVIEPGSPTLTALTAAIDGNVNALTLQIVMPLATSLQANLYVDAMARAMANNAINTPLRQSHFLAQLGHESGSLRYAAELSSGVQYEGRKDLGNTESGDGPRFKGRGLIQLTGRANYTAFGKARGRDFVTGDNPQLLASDAGLAADCSGWFWSVHNLNALADTDQAVAITKVINGGTNGLDDRLRRLKLTKCFLGLS